MTNFLESSAEELYQNAVKGFPYTKMRQYATHSIIIKELRWTPFVGVKTLFIKGLAQNEEREYNPMILFKDVDYKGKEVKIIASDGLEYNFDKLSLENTDVLLRCSCGDFFWRFNFYNHLDKSLYGTKRKKYESQGGPPANPMEVSGMCKHLMKMVKVLTESGIFIENTIKESVGLKLWLDDQRNPKDPKIQALFGSTGDEIWVKTAFDAIFYLQQGDVASISFDHDLGENAGSGMDVANWIEEQAFNKTIPRLDWRIHSKNSIGCKNMLMALKNADRFWNSSNF